MSVTLHTSLGDIKIEINCEAVPVTAYNFLALCASGYYNGCLFHRNMKGFMVQTGDPTGTGKGGESIYGGLFADEIRSELSHDARGVVSMANRGADTNGSQFFITYDKLPYLDKKYTIFGRVINGFDVLDNVEAAQVNDKNKPVDNIRLERITIHANPLAE